MPGEPGTQFKRKKLRNAELITPPNRLKEKVGSGGIDISILERAQKIIETNTSDFRPTATLLVDLMETELGRIQNGQIKGETAIEALIYPAMQLKAQGAMFHYPLITDLSNIMVGFLEIIQDMNKDAIEIAGAFKMSIRVIIRGQIKGDGGAQGTALKNELKDACMRYFHLYHKDLA